MVAEDLFYQSFHNAALSAFSDLPADFVVPDHASMVDDPPIGSPKNSEAGRCDIDCSRRNQAIEIRERVLKSKCFVHKVKMKRSFVLPSKILKRMPLNPE